MRLSLTGAMQQLTARIFVTALAKSYKIKRFDDKLQIFSFLKRFFTMFIGAVQQAR